MYYTLQKRIIQIELILFIILDYITNSTIFLYSKKIQLFVSEQLNFLSISIFF